jgi:hypothetical protein
LTKKIEVKEEKKHKIIMPKWWVVIIVVTIATVWFGRELYLKHEFNKYPIRAELAKTSSFIPMYEMPMQSSSETDLSNDAKAAIIGEYKDWYEIRTRRGDVGWIKKLYIKDTIDMREIIAAQRKMLKEINDSKSKYEY